MSELPEPLTNKGHDVSGLDGFLLNTDLLMASELWALATGDEFKAAVGLWCRAWKQSPPGSLPDDDRILAAFSGAGRDWPTVKEMALRGFVKCSDGRLYHATLCQDAIRASDAKAARVARTKAASEARANGRNGNRDDERNVERDVPQKPNVTKSHSIAGKIKESVCVHTHSGDPEHWDEVERLLKDHANDMNDWEVQFLYSIRRTPSLTKNQAETLKGIVSKMQVAAMPEGEPVPIVVIREGTPEWGELKKTRPRLVARDIQTPNGIVRGEYGRAA